MKNLVLSLALLITAAVPAIAQQSPPPAPAAKPAPPPAKDEPKSDPSTPDTWIFSGALPTTHETYSGTIVASGGQSDFELKLSNGATCEGNKLEGEVGLVRLPEVKCSDDRSFRALFIPQKGMTLKVFGHIGDERFSTEAHLLGTEAPPEPKQSAQPKGPLGLPPSPPAGPMPPPAAK